MWNTDNAINKILGKGKLSRNGDWDGDGVPNWKDCQPRNTMRQDKTIKEVVTTKVVNERYNQRHIKNMQGKINWVIIYYYVNGKKLDSHSIIFFDYANHKDISGYRLYQGDDDYMRYNSKNLNSLLTLAQSQKWKEKALEIHKLKHGGGQGAYLSLASMKHGFNVYNN